MPSDKERNTRVMYVVSEAESARQGVKERKGKDEIIGRGEDKER